MRLKSFKGKPGTILDAFNDHSGEHLGTIMVLELPPILTAGNWLEGKEYKGSVPVVVLKQALPLKHRSGRFPRGFVGLWTDTRVERIN